MTTFEIGKTYYFNTGFGTIIPCKVTARTAKTISIVTRYETEPQRYRIDSKRSQSMNSECIRPYGRNPYAGWGAPALAAKHDKNPFAKKHATA